jgi:hypothetical protein
MTELEQGLRLSLIGAGRLTPLAIKRTEGTLAMSHIFIQGGGLDPEQVRKAGLCPPGSTVLKRNLAGAWNLVWHWLRTRRQ